MTPPISFTEDGLDAAIGRLRALADANTHGSCKILSLGDACVCPLCDVDRVRHALRRELVPPTSDEVEAWIDADFAPWDDAKNADLLRRQSRRIAELTKERDEWKAHCQRWRKTADQLSQKLAELQRALEELIALKDAKDSGFGASIKMTAESERTRLDYEKRKPLAWAAARAALNRPAQPSEESNG